jgi:hypothetical protein
MIKLIQCDSVVINQLFENMIKKRAINEFVPDEISLLIYSLIIISAGLFRNFFHLLECVIIILTADIKDLRFSSLVFFEIIDK